MQSRGLWTTLAALCAVLAVFFAPRAFAQNVVKSNVDVQWTGQAIVNVTLTPNYHAGFGTVAAVVGAQPTPSPGPNARCGTGCGDIDFGSVLQGVNYLYKYALDLHVTSNSGTGLNVYGEGAADFSTQINGDTIPIQSALFWLNSTNGVDGNTGFSPSVAFQKDVGNVVTPALPSYGTAPTITYSTYPAAISSTALSNTDFYYDYQLKVPFNANPEAYYVWVVYTVVAR